MWVPRATGGEGKWWINRYARRSAVRPPGQGRPDTSAATHREGARELPAYVLFGFPRTQRPLTLEVGVGIPDDIIGSLLDIRICSRDALTGYAAYRHGDLRLRSSPHPYLYQ